MTVEERIGKLQSQLSECLTAGEIQARIDRMVNQDDHTKLKTDIFDLQQRVDSL